MRPAVMDVLVEEAMAVPVLALSNILGADGAYAQGERLVLRNNAFWLFRFLSQGESQSDFKRFLLRILNTSDPLAILEGFYGERVADGQTLEQWWSQGFEQMLERKMPPFLSMGASRQLVEELSFVLYEDAGSVHRITGAEIWKQRNVPAFRKALAARLRQIKLEMQQVNPLYFNALLYLGRSYESVLVDRAQYFFEDQAMVQEETAQARQMELRIDELLAW